MESDPDKRGWRGAKVWLPAACVIHDVRWDRTNPPMSGQVGNVLCGLHILQLRWFALQIRRLRRCHLAGARFASDPACQQRIQL